MYFSIAIGLMLAIAFIYADYVPHAQFYAKEYDRLCLRDGGKEDKPDEVRGLARIYYSEYQNTHFKNHDKWYEQNDQLEAFDESDNSVERDYILCYLWSHLANVQDTGIIVSVALLVFFIGLTTAVATVRPVRLRIMDFIAQIEENYSAVSIVYNENEGIVVPDEWKGKYYPYFIPDNSLQYLPKLNTPSEILNSLQLKQLHSNLPDYHKYTNLKLHFSISVDGSSLKSFYNRCYDRKINNS